MLRLYVDSLYCSPYAMSAFVALHEKALSFEVVTVDLETGQNRAGEYAAQSLTQRVPTLVHEGFALSESSAIAEYLDEVLPGPRLYPADPKARARARQVQAWVRSDLMPIRAERSTELMFYRAHGKPLSADAQAAAQKLFDAAHALLAPKYEYLADQWSIADHDLATMLNRLVWHGDPVPRPLADYVHRQWTRPAVQVWVSQHRPPLPDAHKP